MKFPRPRAFRRRQHHPLSWGRRARLLLLDLLGRAETPERVAAALAVGVGVGFSPFIGVHIWMALALALIFRLNKIDTILGQFAGNPWTLPPSFAAGYHLGRFVLGYDATEVPELPWSKLLHRDFWKSFTGEGPGASPRFLPSGEHGDRGRRRGGDVFRLPLRLAALPPAASARGPACGAAARGARHAA